MKVISIKPSIFWALICSPRYCSSMVRGGYILFMALLFIQHFGFSQGNVLNFGPTFSLPHVLDSKVGIIGSNEPKSFITFPGYSFAFRKYFNRSRFQYGIALTHDYIKYGVYLRYWFPEDGLNNTTSKLKFISKSFEFGLQAGIRYGWNDFYFNFNLGYDIPISSATVGFFELGFEKNETLAFKNNHYSKKHGPVFRFDIEKGFNKFSLGFGVLYKDYRQQYRDDIFLHYWKTSPIVLGAYLSYKI